MNNEMRTTDKHENTYHFFRFDIGFLEFGWQITDSSLRSGTYSSKETIYDSKMNLIQSWSDNYHNNFVVEKALNDAAYFCLQP